MLEKEDIIENHERIKKEIKQRVDLAIRLYLYDAVRNAIKELLEEGAGKIGQDIIIGLLRKGLEKDVP